jgi:hypothetical protein
MVKGEREMHITVIQTIPRTTNTDVPNVQKVLTFSKANEPSTFAKLVKAFEPVAYWPRKGEHWPLSIQEQIADL